MNVQKHIELLGLEVKDRVTGFRGIVTSVSFDLYGCLQAVVNPAIEKTGRLADQHWFDVTRLKVLSQKPVMEVPNFEYPFGPKGPAEKPAGKA